MVTRFVYLTLNNRYIAKPGYIVSHLFGCKCIKILNFGTDSQGVIKMFKKLLMMCLMVGFAFSIFGFSQQRTEVNDAKMKTKLLGKHMFSLQWISWDYFGSATVTEKKGVLSLNGMQKSRENDDYVKIDGEIKKIDSKSFVFEGTVETKISHINGGNLCIRDGEMTFAITKNRKYWRLQDINNPCDDVADYIDIYFRK